MSLLPSKPEASPPDDADPRVIGVDSDDADDVLAALSSETARQLLSNLHEEPAPPSELATNVDTSVQNAQYHLEKLKTAGAIEVVDTAYSEKGREMDVYAPSDQPLVIFAGDEQKGSTLRSALSRLLGSVGILAAASLAVQAISDSGFPWIGDPSGADGDAAPPDDSGAPPSGGDADMDDGGEPVTNRNGDESQFDATEQSTDIADLNENITFNSDGQVTVDPDNTYTVTSDGNTTLTWDGNVTFSSDGNATLASDGNTTIIADVTDAVPTGSGTEEVVTPSPTPTPESAQAATETASSLPPGVLFFAGGLFVLAVIAVVVYFKR